MKKKLISMLLALVLCVGLAATASAATYTGVTGACTWIFDDSTGVLTISGSGKMADYDSSNNPPWASYKDSIKKVVINEGVTTIGNSAFSKYSALTEVIIPGSVSVVGSNAFYNCSSLKNVEYWGITAPDYQRNAFSSTTVKNIQVPDNYSSSNFCGKRTNKGLEAIDSEATHNISISASPAEGGIVTGAGTYHTGKVAITAEANPGYRFVEWQESDAQISTDSTYILTANMNYSIVAVFEKEAAATTTYTVTLPTGTGYTATAVEGSSSPVDKGGSYSFTVTISDGYRKGSGFAVKTNDTLLTEKDGKYTISNINEDQDVTVEGVEKIPTYTVSISVNPTEGGTVSASPATEVQADDTVTLTVTPAAGYEIDTVKYNDTVVNPENGAYTFTMPAENVTVTATFEKITYTVTYKPGTYGSGAEATATKYHGVNLTLEDKIFTRFCYTQIGWATTEGGVQVYTLNGSYTANAPLELYPVWQANTYNAVFNADGGTWANGETTKTVSTVFGEVIAAPEDPTRTGYSFTGWSPALGTMDAEGKTFTAQWSINEYTIAFKNEDGTVLQTGKVAYGETPVYTGATPAKAATAQYTYTFKGWTPAIADVTGDATYTATYDSTNCISRLCARCNIFFVACNTFQFQTGTKTGTENSPDASCAGASLCLFFI